MIYSPVPHAEHRDNRSICDYNRKEDAKTKIYTDCCGVTVVVVVKRITQIRRSLGTYHALAALTQLPDESDFGDGEAEATVESADVGAMHPDRLALWPLLNDYSALSRSFGETGANGDGMNACVDDRSGSRESSVDSIIRVDSLDGDVRGQQNHTSHNHAS